MPLLGRVVAFVQRHVAARDFLHGVNTAALGLIAAVTIQVAAGQQRSLPAGLLALGSFALLLWQPLATPLVVLVGAVVGALLWGAG